LPAKVRLKRPPQMLSKGEELIFVQQFNADISAYSLQGYFFHDFSPRFFTKYLDLIKGLI
jgi:hypothetical protein